MFGLENNLIVKLFQEYTQLFFILGILYNIYIIVPITIKEYFNNYIINWIDNKE